MSEEEKDYYDSNEFLTLLRKYEETLAAGKTPYFDSDDIADLIEYYWSIGEDKKAIEAMELGLKMHPGEIGPLAFKARLALYEDKDADKAQKIAEQITDTTDIEYLFLKLEILLGQNKIEDAILLVNKELSNITDIDDYNAFVKDCAEIFNNFGLGQKAIEWMMENTKFHRPDEIKEIIGRTFFNNGEYEKSKKVFNELLDKDPYSGTYWNDLSSAQMLSGEIEEAIHSAEYAIAINPDDTDALRMKAEALFDLENYEESLKFFTRYTDLKPNDESAQVFICTILVSMGRDDEAMDKICQLEELFNDDNDKLTKIYTEKIFILITLKRFDEALSVAEKLEAVANVRYKCNVNLLRGHILLSSGKYEEAKAYFKKALNDEYTTQDLVLQIAASYLDNGKYEDAYQTLKESIDFDDPQCDIGLAQMALCHKEMGNNEEFLKYLKLATERTPRDAYAFLREYFPEGMKVEDYYEYMRKNLNNKK